MTMTLLSKAVLLFILSPTIIVGQLEGNPGSVKPKRPCWTTCPISVAHKTLIQKVHNIVYSQDVKGTTIGIDFGVTPTTTEHQKNYYRNLAALLTLTMPPSNPILNYYRYENGGGGACDAFNFCRRRVCEKGAIMIGSYDSLFSITSTSNFDGISALVQGKNMIDSATCPSSNEMIVLIANSALHPSASIGSWPPGSKSFFGVGVGNMFAGPPIMPSLNSVASNVVWAGADTFLVSDSFTEMTNLYNTLKCIDHRCCHDHSFHYLEKPKLVGKPWNPALFSTKKARKASFSNTDQSTCINFPE